MSQWRELDSAPRDGRAIKIAVDGRDDFGWPYHELPFLVSFLNGRWVYARSRSPLFAWHVPRMWKPAHESVTM